MVTLTATRHPPLLSIVTPSFNQARFIRQTIDSVLSQNYPHIEHIVVDGSSTDGTVDILQEYGGRFPERFRWVSEPDKGQSDALNKGLAMARGEIIGWQNSDDYYYSGALQALAGHLAENPDAAVAYGDYDRVDERGMRTQTFRPGPFDLARFMGDVYVANQAALFRKAAIASLGGIDENLQCAMDYDLLLKLGCRYRLDYVPGVAGAYRWHSAGKTLSNGLQSATESYHVLERLSVPLQLEQSRRTMLGVMLSTIIPLAIARGQDALAADLLDRAIRLDPELQEWQSGCERMLSAIQGDWLLGKVHDTFDADTPVRLNRLLAAKGVSCSQAARATTALVHLYWAMDPGSSHNPRVVAAHLARAIAAHRWWLHSPQQLNKVLHNVLKPGAGHSLHLGRATLACYVTAGRIRHLVRLARGTQRVRPTGR